MQTLHTVCCHHRHNHHLPCNQTLSQSFRRIECTTKTVVAAEQFRQFALIFAIILFPLQRRDDIQISHVHYVGQFFVTATISRLSSSINFLCRFAQSATKKCCFLLQFNASCTHFLDSKCRNFSEMLAFWTRSSKEWLYSSLLIDDILLMCKWKIPTKTEKKNYQSFVIAVAGFAMECNDQYSGFI